MSTVPCSGPKVWPSVGPDASDPVSLQPIHMRWRAWCKRCHEPSQWFRSARRRPAKEAGIPHA
eukprot:9609195-Lingulodinium_polyedra.AAC.1